MPEGLAVAAALAALNYNRVMAVAIGGATGLIEPIAGVLGAAAVSVFQPLLPWGLGFAAGAMIFVISNEIVPETHRHGHESMATAGTYGRGRVDDDLRCRIHLSAFQRL